jgi:predicted Zn-dependent protease
MTASPRTPDLASRVADRLTTDAPWDVIGQRATSFELHLQGTRVELERGPLTLEGYGLRVFRPRGEGLGVGFQASTDLSAEGIRAVVHDAQSTAAHAEFPAKSVELPSAKPGARDVAVVDEHLWEDPAGTLAEYVHALVQSFEGRKGVVPTFGSVKATLSEQSLANSAGLRVGFVSTFVEVELGVKAFGGPEGAPPGEYWVTRTGRSLPVQEAGRSVDDWCRYAADVRRAVPPPSGDQAVVLPPDVLSGILPHVLGVRFAGSARLRKVAPEVGAQVGADTVTVRDEGDVPWAVGSSPYDDEGTVRSRQTLIDHGRVSALLYDALYASAFETTSTGNGNRSRLGPPDAIRFTNRPGPSESTLVVPPGDGGTIEELVEAAGDGLLVTQLGWASPDAISGAFGGEVRIGYRIRGGKVAEPVRGGTVGGIVFSSPGAPSMLASARSVGKTPELVDRLSSPPWLVRPLSVGGA